MIRTCRNQHGHGAENTRSHLKKRILVHYRDGCEVQTGGILAYFEDLNRAPNKESGPKNFFEIASSVLEMTGIKRQADLGFYRAG